MLLSLSQLGQTAISGAVARHADVPLCNVRSHSWICQQHHCFVGKLDVYLRSGWSAIKFLEIGIFTTYSAHAKAESCWEVWRFVLPTRKARHVPDRSHPSNNERHLFCWQLWRWAGVFWKTTVPLKRPQNVHFHNLWKKASVVDPAYIDTQLNNRGAQVNRLSSFVQKVQNPPSQINQATRLRPTTQQMCPLPPRL